MIAYDGADDSAIDDLQFAGLPRRGEASIVAVQDLVQPAVVSDFDLVERSIVSRRVLSTAALLQREQPLAATENLKAAVAEAVENVRLYLPEWTVEGKVLSGVPARALLDEVESQKPDLLVVGSHKRTAFGRFFLGSVSLELAEKSNVAVRVARLSATENFLAQPRVVVPVDDSPTTESVVRHVGSRVWNEETKIRLVVAKSEDSANKDSKVLSQKQLKLEWAIEQFENIGLNVSVEFSPDYLPEALFRTAIEWRANSIFVHADRYEKTGARGLHETAIKLLTGANCSVEIVR